MSFKVNFRIENGLYASNFAVDIKLGFLMINLDSKPHLTPYKIMAMLK